MQNFKEKDNHEASASPPGPAEYYAIWAAQGGAMEPQFGSTVACMKGLVMVERLISSGYPLPAWLVKDRLEDMHPHAGAWALIRAKIWGLEEAFALLRSAGKSIFAKDAEGDTLIHLSIQKNRRDIVKFLVSFEPVFTKKIDRNWLTPLHLSAKVGNIELVKFFLNQGCSVHWKTVESLNVLHVAAQSNHADIVELLLGAGARIDDKERLHGYTALHICAMSGLVESLEVLMKHGANLEAENIILETPLHLAVVHDQPDCLRALIRAGASVNTRTQYGDTAVHVCVKKGRTECLRILITNSANLIRYNDSSKTPLTVALERNYIEGVELLIRGGATM